MSTRTRLAVLASISAAAFALAPNSALATTETSTQRPTAPTNLRVAGLTYASVTLAWDAGSDDSGWVQYVIEIRTAPQYLQRYAALGTTKTFTNLSQGTTYTATIWAVDAENNESAPVSIEFTTPVDIWAPTAPANLRPVFVNGQFDAIAWDRAVDDSDQVTYFMWSGSEVVLITGELGISVFDLVYGRCLVLAGSVHTFTVQARDPAGNWSAHSNPITVTFPT